MQFCLILASSSFPPQTINNFQLSISLYKQQQHEMLINEFWQAFRFSIKFRSSSARHVVITKSPPETINKRFLFMHPMLLRRFITFMYAWEFAKLWSKQSCAMHTQNNSLTLARSFSCFFFGAAPRSFFRSLKRTFVWLFYTKFIHDIHVIKITCYFCFLY